MMVQLGSPSMLIRMMLLISVVAAFTIWGVGWTRAGTSSERFSNRSDHSSIDLTRSTVSIDRYIDEVEGRWLSEQETEALMLRWRDTLAVPEYRHMRIRIASIDLDRDGSEELIVLNMNSGAFAVFKFDGGDYRLYGRYSSTEYIIPKLVDFEGNGMIDLVQQGGRGWSVMLYRTTGEGIQWIVSGRGGLELNAGQAWLRQMVPCGSVQARYSGVEGLGAIQSHVMYQYVWSHDQEAFVLRANRDANDRLVNVLWVCLFSDPASEGDRYVDYWNWAVCLLAARLEYDRALELARMIPDHSPARPGETMDEAKKKLLIARLTELSETYTSGSRLETPAAGNAPKWRPAK